MSKRKDMQHIFNADVDKSSSWHSVAKGDEPLSYIDCLFSYGDGQIAKGFMLDNRCVYLEEKSLMIDIEDVSYWVSISAISEKVK